MLAVMPLALLPCALAVDRIARWAGEEWGLPRIGLALWLGVALGHAVIVHRAHIRHPRLEQALASLPGNGAAAAVNVSIALALLALLAAAGNRLSGGGLRRFLAAEA